MSVAPAAYSPKKIPVAKPRLPRLPALSPYIERIDAARWYSNFGPLNQAFEARVAEMYGLPPQCVSTIANATVALDLALQATGAPPGAHCLLPSWTFSASVHAVVAAGLIPFFVDVSVEEPSVLTPETAREIIRERPERIGAVMPVAFCGQPIDPAPWEAFARESGVPVVLDAAPGFDSAKPGAMISAVSLHATKVLGVGEGGFVMSEDPDLVAAVRLKSNFGFHGDREARVAASNGKLSEYAAAVGLAGLDEWPARRSAFLAAARRYRDNLAGTRHATLQPGWGESWISSTCSVRLSDPDATPRVLEALHEAGVETRAWWGRGMHTHRAFAGYPRLDLPNTEILSRTVLGLPFFIDMAPDEIDLVCDVLLASLDR